MPNTVANATKNFNYRAGDQDSKVSRQVGDQNSLSFVYLDVFDN